MSEPDDFSMRGRGRPSSPAAKARLAQALRENLQRRKAQSRGQDQQEKVPEADDPESGGEKTPGRG